jgi:hypothetical protein
VLSQEGEVERPGQLLLRQAGDGLAGRPQQLYPAGALGAAFQVGRDLS